MSDLDNEELYFTKRMNGAIKDEDVEDKFEYIKYQIITGNLLRGYTDLIYFSNAIEIILNELKYRECEIKKDNKRIDSLINEVTIKQCEIDKKDREIQIKNNYLDLIWQIGYDYDGLNKTESLKELIDELVDLAIKAKNNDDKSVIYEGHRGKEIINQNILFEKVDETNG